MEPPAASSQPLNLRNHLALHRQALGVSVDSRYVVIAWLFLSKIITSALKQQLECIAAYILYLVISIVIILFYLPSGVQQSKNQVEGR